MRIWVPVVRFVLLVLAAGSAITAQLSREQPGADAVVLPNQGTLDERPFFSTRRHPSIAYDELANDRVAELARKVDDGTVQLRFNGSSGYLLSVLQALGVPAES